MENPVLILGDASAMGTVDDLIRTTKGLLAPILSIANFKVSMSKISENSPFVDVWINPGRTRICWAKSKRLGALNSILLSTITGVKLKTAAGSTSTKEQNVNASTSHPQGRSVSFLRSEQKHNSEIVFEFELQFSSDNDLFKPSVGIAGRLRIADLSEHLICFI